MPGPQTNRRMAAFRLDSGRRSAAEVRCMWICTQLSAWWATSRTGRPRVTEMLRIGPAEKHGGASTAVSSFRCRPPLDAAATAFLRTYWFSDDTGVTYCAHWAFFSR